jgi:hypothetical protein
MSTQTSRRVGDDDAHPGSAKPSGSMGGRLAFAWAFVGVPLAYGIFETAKKASALFTG